MIGEKGLGKVSVVSGLYDLLGANKGEKISLLGGLIHQESTQGRLIMSRMYC